MAATPSKLAPGVLTHQEILDLCGLRGNQREESKGVGPIQPCRRENVRSASYDLRLGPEFHFKEALPPGGHSVGKMRVARLTAGSSEHIVLQPNQVVVVSSLEKICLPEDMIGHLTLKQDILLQGLIMASQSQIDAGYHGWIYPLLYNLTDGEVMLQLNRSVIRLELVRLSQRTDRPYEGDYQGRGLSESLKRPIGSSLTALRDDVEEQGKEVRERLSRFRTWGAVLAVLAILLPFASGFVGDVYDTRDRVSRVEVKLEEPLKLEDEVVQLKSRLSTLQCQMREQEGKPTPRRC